MSVASGNAEVGDTLPVRIRSPPPFAYSAPLCALREGGSASLTERPKGVVTLRHPANSHQCIMYLMGRPEPRHRSLTMLRLGGCKALNQENSIIRGVAQPGSVLVSVTRGRRFKSDLPDQNFAWRVGSGRQRRGQAYEGWDACVSWFMAKTDGADEPDRSAYKGSIPFVMRNLLCAGIVQLGERRRTI